MKSEQGKKGCKKIGRGKDRPAQKRYVAESRCDKNKHRNIEAAKKAIAPETMKTPRGSTRAARRFAALTNVDHAS